MPLTAIQIANAAATIGNDGVPVQPRIVDSVTAPDGTTETMSPVEGETGHQTRDRARCSA